MKLRTLLLIGIYLSLSISSFSQFGAGIASYDTYTKTKFGAFLNNIALPVATRGVIARDSLHLKWVRTSITVSTWSGSSNAFRVFDSLGLNQFVGLIALPTGTEQPFVDASGISGYQTTVADILDTYPQIKVVAVDNEEFTDSYHSGPLSNYGLMIQAVSAEAHKRGVLVTEGGMIGIGVAMKVYRWLVTKYNQSTADNFASSLSLTTTIINASKTPNSNPTYEAFAKQVDTVESYKQYLDFVNFHGYEVLDLGNSRPDTVTHVTPNVYRYTKEYFEDEWKLPCLSNEVGQNGNTQPALVTDMMTNFVRLGFQYVLWYDNSGPAAEPITDPSTGEMLSNGQAFADFMFNF